MRSLCSLKFLAGALLSMLLLSCISTSVKAQDPMQFIRKNKIDKMQKYIDNGAALNQKYSDIYLVNPDESNEFAMADGFLLNFAYAYDRKEIFEMILSAIEHEDNYYEQLSSCLTQMISNSDYENLTRFIDLGAEVDTKCEVCQGIYPLHAALENKDYRFFDKIQSFNPDLTVLDPNGLNILHYAVWGDHFDFFTKMIEEYNFDIWNGYPENSILFAAAGVENSDFIKYIYKNMSNDKRFNINASDSLGLIPIHVASYTSLNNLKLIEHKGGNINFQDIDGYNSLHYAAWNGKAEIAKYLIEEKSMDANLLTLDEMNPMLLAVESGDLETVKVIAASYDGTYYKTVLKTAKKLDDKSIYLYLKPLLKY